MRIGKTGEVYLLNAEGIYQTTPRFGGAIMETCTIPHGALPRRHPIRVLEQD